MSIVLRGFQEECKYAVYDHWRRGNRNVVVVLPTGSGKTVLYSNIVSEYVGASCISAHRQELVSQTCLALARCGVRHGIIAPQAVIKNIIALEIKDTGRSYYDANAKCRVASVDTLRGIAPTDPWLQQVGLYVTDEGHHLLRDNKWGKCAAMFPNAFLLGVTATPLRADGQGLGKDSDGLYDAMVVGPTMRELIDMGWLCDYRIFAPPSDVDVSEVPITASGDYSPEPLRKAVHKSNTLVGDIVKHYLRIAPGKLGITFAVDVEAATEIAQAYRTAGVPAEVITGNTPILERQRILERFKRREVLQLVNCDVLGEGYDLPALEVVTFARPTMSYGLYKQQFGRVSRIMEGKDFGLVIDHVNNVRKHGLPDRERPWSLKRRERKTKAVAEDMLPTTTCLNPQGGPNDTPCLFVYERIYKCCPRCGFQPEPAARSGPEFVDGDLAELSPEVLRVMRGEIDRVDGAVFYPKGADGPTQAVIRRNHIARQEAQKALRLTMMQWGGQPHRVGNESQAQREFYLRFGIDVWSAMTLNTAEAFALREKIEKTP